jgi:hypothetical protein
MFDLAMLALFAVSLMMLGKGRTPAVQRRYTREAVIMQRLLTSSRHRSSACQD